MHTMTILYTALVGFPPTRVRKPGCAVAFLSFCHLDMLSYYVRPPDLAHLLTLQNKDGLVMAVVVPGVLKNSILLGQVVPSTLTKAIKVKVPYFVFNETLKAYFKQTETFVARDGLSCKVRTLLSWRGKLFYI